MNNISTAAAAKSGKSFFPVDPPAVCTDKSVSGSRSKDRETVMIVDDEASILALCKTMLEMHHYKVLATRSAEKAVAMARQFHGPIHLLLTDVVMPEMNGRELKDRIREIRPDIKTLFMSGHTVDICTGDDLMKDNTGFLQKPFSINALAEHVRCVLARQPSHPDHDI